MTLTKSIPSRPAWGAVQHIRERQLRQSEDTAPSSKSLSLRRSVPYIRLVRAQYEKDGAGAAVSTDSLERIVMLLM